MYLAGDILIYLVLQDSAMMVGIKNKVLYKSRMLERGSFYVAY